MGRTGGRGKGGLVALQQSARSVELHGVVSARTQQRGQATGRKRQQERQPAGAGDACGDGVAHDPLAAGVSRLAQVDASAGRCQGKCRGAQEGDLAVDLWRLFTGQTTAEKLGLIYMPEVA